MRRRIAHLGRAERLARQRRVKILRDQIRKRRYRVSNLKIVEALVGALV